MTNTPTREEIKKEGFAYRYKCSVDRDGRSCVVLMEYAILRETKCGFRISYPGRPKGKRSSSHEGGYCHKSKEVALKHFRLRTHKYAGILQARMNNAQDCIRIAEKYPEKVLALYRGHAVREDCDEDSGEEFVI